MSTFFPRLDQTRFDSTYRGYLTRVITTDDRREFDLESMALVASLRDGHSWFYDDWLDERYGQSVGFVAYPTEDKWTVRRTRLDAVTPGDVITAVDGVPIREFFDSVRRYLSGSSDRDTQSSLFLTPAIWPLRFALTLDDGRRVVVDREHERRRDSPAPRTEGKWIEPESIAYVKLPVMHGLKLIADAVEFVRQFQAAGTIVVDVRGNEGGGFARALQDALMERPYPLWTEHSTMPGGALLRSFQGPYSPRIEVSASQAMGDPGRSEVRFKGRLLLLVDRECSCACEDFVMPFKVTHRGLLIGETTAGTFSYTARKNLDNGMRLNIAEVRNTFPDGSPFEGVGISPDVPVNVTAEDLKAGRDPVFLKAIQIAAATRRPD